MEFINIKSDDEIKKLAALAHSIWHEYWPAILTPEQIDYMVEKFQSYNAIREQIENENYIYNIIKEGNTQIGYFGAASKEDYFFLSKLYIKKDFRGLGFGKKSLLEVIKLSSKFNKNSIRLTVNKYNTNTIKAYEKWNFKIIDSVVTDIGNGFVMDDYIMELKNPR
ncbi:MAG: GNAT family N-acetyltransferase [Candidatus Gastranaerophilales bacterium]|nr:GNAT family N-acetyltransferase [Candidatus Gastranaerophilales bacterium]